MGGCTASPASPEIGRGSCRGSEWSSDVCSSDLDRQVPEEQRHGGGHGRGPSLHGGIRNLWVAALPARLLQRSEEGRAGEVSGVQTCALPISIAKYLRSKGTEVGTEGDRPFMGEFGTYGWLHCQPGFSRDRKRVVQGK